MLYIYTQSDCPACEAKKLELRAKKIFFIERDASRMKNLANKDSDEADREALIVGSEQNMVLPILVELEPSDD